MMVDVDDIIELYSLKPTTFKLAKDDTDKLKEIIEDIILESEDLIKTYTNNPFKKGTPKAVQRICKTLVSNIILFTVQRRDSPIIKVNDWNIQTVSDDIFTDNIKKSLEPYVIEYSNKSDPINIFAITGED